MLKESQGELFDDLKEKDFSLKQFAKNMMPQRNLQVVQISMDMGIFLVILFLLVMIVAFAFGVETGKKSVAKRILDNYSAAAERNFVPVNDAAKAQPKTNTVNTKSAVKTSKPFTVQVGAFTGSSEAEKVSNGLKKMGVDAVIVPNGRLFTVNAGSYSTEKEAIYAQKLFSVRYKGCFVKKNI